MSSNHFHPSSVGEGNDPDADFDAVEAVDLEPDPQRLELAAQKELNLRLTADFENFKRRSRQDAELRAAAQKESFIRELLPVIDNLERALVSGASDVAGPFYQGVAMTLQQLQFLLYQHGVETDEIVGQLFDPHRHEALSQRYDPSQPDRAILEVFQRGYRRGEKVFRPAKVVVNDLAHSRDVHHVH